MSKVYIGNLSFGTTEESLTAFIRECGVEVASVRIVRDRYTSRSRGFGFAELGDGQDADDAIAVLDGKVFDGRTLKVDHARERTGGGGGGHSRGNASW